MEIIYFVYILLSFTLILFSKYLSNKFKLFDYPDKKRKFHKSPVLLVGGIYFSLIINFFYIFNFFFKKKMDTIFSIDANYYWILLIINLGLIIGLLDDKYNLKASIKLFLAFIVFIFSFIYLDNQFYLTKLISFNEYEIIIDGKITSFIFTSLCFVILVNALNMIDGINCLLSSIVVFWLLIFNYILNLNTFFSFLNIFLIFGLIIFIFFNFKSKIFLGDSGCFVLSFYICYQTVFIYNRGLILNDKILNLESIFLLFFIPGIDMIRLIFTRAIAKKNPFRGDRNHLHHILISKYNLLKTLIIYLFLVTVPFTLYLVYPYFLNYFLIFTLIIYSLLVLRIRYEKN